MRVVCTDIPDMFFVSGVCWPASLAYVHTLTCIAGRFIDPSRWNGFCFECVNISNVVLIVLYAICTWEFLNLRRKSHNWKKNISQWLNGIDTNLKFKLTVENNSCISFLDLNIQRKPDKIELGVYRKEANTDITIHNNSKHPQSTKLQLTDST